MPEKVPQVRWKCPQCKKTFWLKPGKARTKKYCSRRCYYVSNVVESPVRAKRANVTVRYGVHECEKCSVEFEAKTKVQRFCSQSCQLKHAQDKRRRGRLPEAKCENCSKAFMPRHGSAGRFCSFECKNLGQRGKNAPNWLGGRHSTAEGYIKVYAPTHPNASGHGGYVKEHRLVMEKHLGRLLEPHETIHHINGDKADNRLGNLQLRSGRHGRGSQASCGDCGSTNIVFTEL